MILTPYEDQQVHKLSHEEAYQRIKIYYSNFIKKWNTLSPLTKNNYVFGTGRSGSVEYVNDSSDYINSLQDNPSIEDSIVLAKNVFTGRLEFSFHDKDEFGIRMGAYAHYVINKFNNGQF